MSALPRVASPGHYMLCAACKGAGKERKFRTLVGYKDHLIRYHGAKLTDTIGQVTNA